MEEENNREKRANEYEKRHGDQQKWYSNRAGRNKTLFESIGIAIVVIAAITSLVPVLDLDGPSPPNLTDQITSFLAGLIVILKGLERIWLPEEKWQNYRKASEALKRERELFIEKISPYDNDADEEKDYKLYVKRCCLIKAEEQNNFWGLTSKNNNCKDKNSE